MVHFGHYIEAHKIPGWERYYLGYKQLKKRINEYANCALAASDDERKDILKRFSNLLDSQVESIVLFLIEKQGILAGRLQNLREERENTQVNDEDGMKSIVHPGQYITQLLEDYRDVGNELLKLLQFVEMNAMGLRKILKKFDKRLGFHLRENYLLSRINHPYSQLQQVLRQVGIGAIIATISQNITELHVTIGDTWRSSSSTSLYKFHPRIVEEEPIIKAIEAQFQRLTKEASLLSFVANSFLLQPPKENLLEVFVDEKEYHFLSTLINLINTFLYMVNYYIIVPTSDDYAKSLQMPATLSGIIIGSMPLTAIISALIFSWWSNYSYMAPLISSTILLIAGNFMYALALHFNSVWLLLFGRAFEGLGCARAVNRRYIMHEVPPSRIQGYSAAFVSASALGMTVGPALASVLDMVDFKILGASVNSETAPGWLMGLLWIFYLLLVVTLFKEPKRLSEVEPKINNTTLSSGNGKGDSHVAIITQPLLSKTNEEDPKENSMDLGSLDEHSVRTIKDVVKEMTLPVQILLGNYFMLKFAAEMLISEASLITSHYFSWSSGKVGLFLGGLGLTVIPSSAVVANHISNRYQERLIIMWTLILVAIGVIGIFCYCPFIEYTEAQYITAAFVIFISTNVLEGVDMSLLAKVMSPRLSQGLFNCGFLSTEAGTLARAVADVSITLIGKAGMASLLNFSMIPTLFIVVATIVFTSLGYYSLY